MKYPKRHSRGAAPCESIGPEDGIDSRLLFRGRASKKSDHKDHQLCRQVFETLSYLLAGDLGDERLHSLIVEAVAPAPDASRLLVSFRQAELQPDHDATEALAALKGASAHIRCEIARVVVRKRVPELVFQVLPESEVP